MPLFAVLLYQYLIMPNISQLHEGHIIVCNGKALPVDMKLGMSVEQGKHNIEQTIFLLDNVSVDRQKDF